jgi:hypothetical protein
MASSNIKFALINAAVAANVITDITDIPPAEQP